MEQASNFMRVNYSLRKWSYSRIGFATSFLGLEVDERARKLISKTFTFLTAVSVSQNKCQFIETTIHAT